jgi:hypothetical protein
MISSVSGDGKTLREDYHQTISKTGLGRGRIQSMIIRRKNASKNKNNEEDYAAQAIKSYITNDS